MTGHWQVVQARRAGYRPLAVFLFVGAPGEGAPPAERDMRDGLLPAVWTMGASPKALDLRFLLGLRVHVWLHEGSSEMFWSWWDAIKEAKPAQMFGVEPDGEVVTWQP
jgi:hypothetical protein